MGSYFVGNLGAVPHRGVTVPYFSDLIYEWLVEKVGNHEIKFYPNSQSGMYAVRIDGILIGWVFDSACKLEIASGTEIMGGVFSKTVDTATRRRRDTFHASDPLLFDKWWERIMLIDKDCVVSCGYSIVEYRK